MYGLTQEYLPGIEPEIQGQPPTPTGYRSLGETDFGFASSSPQAAAYEFGRRVEMRVARMLRWLEPQLVPVTSVGALDATYHDQETGGRVSVEIKGGHVHGKQCRFLLNEEQVEAHEESLAMHGEGEKDSPPHHLWHILGSYSTHDRIGTGRRQLSFPFSKKSYPSNKDPHLCVECIYILDTSHLQELIRLGTRRCLDGREVVRVSSKSIEEGLDGTWIERGGFRYYKAVQEERLPLNEHQKHPF